MTAAPRPAAPPHDTPTTPAPRPRPRPLTIAEVTGIARIAFGGRAPEAREPGLLASAVHRPRARMFGVAAYTGVYEQAAALLHALATNHPLVDGNKRTAWLAAASFLAVNGVDPVAVDQDAAYALVIDVASGAEGDVAVIAGRLRELCEVGPIRA